MRDHEGPDRQAGSLRTPQKRETDGRCHAFRCFTDPFKSSCQLAVPRASQEVPNNC